MATKPLPADVAADRAAALIEYEKEQIAARKRMEAQRAARLARDARLAKKADAKKAGTSPGPKVP
jgi:hypothetical protein